MCGDYTLLLLLYISAVVVHLRRVASELRTLNWQQQAPLHHSALTPQTLPVHYGSTAVASGTAAAVFPQLGPLRSLVAIHSKRGVTCHPSLQLCVLGQLGWLENRRVFFWLGHSHFFCLSLWRMIHHVPHTRCLHPYSRKSLDRTMPTSNDAGGYFFLVLWLRSVVGHPPVDLRDRFFFFRPSFLLSPLRWR